VTPSPPPPTPFFPSNSKHPSPEPRSPTASVFSVTNNIHTYSSSTPLVYGSHPRLTSSLALLPSSPPIHKEREDAVKEEKSSFPRRENQVGRYGMASRYSFPDGKVRKISDALGCVFCGRASQTPPCPCADTANTYSTFGLDDAFCAGDDGFGIYNDHVCYTYKRWRDADESYRECQDVGHEEAERNKLNAFKGYWWVVSYYSFFSSHFLIYRSFPQPNHNHTRRPRPYSSSKNLHVVFYT